MQLRAAAVMVAVLIIVTGCAASPVAEPSSTAAAAGPSAAATADPAPSAAASPSPLASAANTLTMRCSDESLCALKAGTWVTAGDYAFLPGFSVTVPDGWVSVVEPGQLKLMEVKHREDALRFWIDVAAIESNGSSDTPKILADVPRTPAGLTASFRANPDFTVSTPTTTTIGGTIPALTYTLGVSASARYNSKGCPSYPACANILRDPDHWAPSDFFAIGAPEVVRLYLATVGTASDPHMLVICIDATDQAELDRLTAVEAPIIASISLPAVISNP